MNRLQAEVHRLYFPPDAQRTAPDGAGPGLAGPDGRVRALVLQLARPAGWEALRKVWQGVQADLELPAPAIAVSGLEGYQLWFSLAQPVPAAEAAAFLESLRQRYLRGIARDRVAMTPSEAAAPGQAGQAGQATAVPPVERSPGRWSAFVAADLAALFDDEPWLDLPPSSDAQAELLSRLASIRGGDLQRACARLQSAPSPEAVAAPAPRVDAPAAGPGGLDPRRFLLDVMNDQAVELHLRIEAAKALLPYTEGRRVQGPA